MGAVDHWKEPVYMWTLARHAAGLGMRLQLLGFTRSREADAQPADSVKERGSRGTEEHRGAGKLSIGFFERAKDVGTFSVLQRYRLDWGFVFQPHKLVQRQGK